MAKAELFKIPVFGWLLARLGAFPVVRGTADRKAIRRAIDLLKAGEVVGIFPEGTRTRTGDLLPLQRGAALIALRAGVPVVPVALIGTFKPIRWRVWRPVFNRIRVRIGEPLDMTGIDPGDREAGAALSSRILAGIERLMREHQG